MTPPHTTVTIVAVRKVAVDGQVMAEENTTHHAEVENLYEAKLRLRVVDNSLILEKVTPDGDGELEFDAGDFVKAIKDLSLIDGDAAVNQKVAAERERAARIVERACMRLEEGNDVDKTTAEELRATVLGLLPQQ